MQGRWVEPRSVLTFSRAMIPRDERGGREVGDRYEEPARQALKSIKQIHFGIQTKGCHKCISSPKSKTTTAKEKKKKKYGRCGGGGGERSCRSFDVYRL